MITSPQNPKLKHIKQLNNSKSYRKTHQQFVFENERWISETILKRPHLINYIVCTPEHTTLQSQASKASISIYLCDDRCAQSIAHVQHSAGCFAVLNKPKTNAFTEPVSLAMAVQTIHNPANLGALIRNAQAFHCQALYLIGSCCDVYHPETIRAAAGHLFDLPFITIDSVHDLHHYDCWLLDINASKLISDVKPSDHTCFIFGSETGFNNNDVPAFLNQCKIPMASHVESLNLAVSAGVVLYHYLRLR